jgi:uroporphyrinogen-III synthase
LSKLAAQIISRRSAGGESSEMPDAIVMDKSPQEENQMTKPLAGNKILITRDREQAVGLVNKVKAMGGEPIVFPAIKIAEPLDWGGCDQALKNIKHYDWIVFSSVNSVRFFMQRAIKNGIRAITPSIAVVGDKTESELFKYGRKADLKPNVFDASGLFSAFKNYPLAGKRFLIPGSNIARNKLSVELRKKGARVSPVCCYRTVPNTGQDSQWIKESICANEIDFLTFFSPSAFNSFVDILGDQRLSDLQPLIVRIAAIGPTTAKAIQKKGLKVAIVSDKCDEDNLIQSIQNYIYSHRQQNGEVNL